MSATRSRARKLRKTSPSGSGMRNAEETRERILQAAIDEFSSKGFNGARTAQIAKRSRTNPRMLYHYFGGKKPLYNAVIETTLGELRKAELQFSPEDCEPLDGLLRLLAFVYDHFASHPKLINLLSHENLLHGQFLKQSERVPTISSPVISVITRLLRRGAREKTVRAGLNPLQVYVTMAALSYFHLSNGYTLSTMFQTNILDGKWRQERREHVIELMRAYLEPPR